MKEITDLIKILITSPLDTKKHEAAMEYPMPSTLMLSGHATIWREQHETNSGEFTFAPKLQLVSHK